MDNRHKVSLAGKRDYDYTKRDAKHEMEIIVREP